MDNHGCTPLMLAAVNQDVELVELYLVHGALTNVQDHAGASALWLAAQGGLPSLVQVSYR